MGRGGVETLRFVLRRDAVETAAGEFEWTQLDQLVLGAARERIELVPILYGSPAWLHEVEAHPPLDTPADRQGWKRFLAALIDRYGPRGELWQGPGPQRPVQRWQLWNEPNFDFYWHPSPDADEYARLVQVSAAAIRAADPGAEIILGGVASVRSGVKWWRFMRDLYRDPGDPAGLRLGRAPPLLPGHPPAGRADPADAGGDARRG